MQMTTLDEVNQFLDVTKHNLLVLAENLVELGYRFADSDGPVQLASQQDVEKVNDVEDNEGRLPMLFRHWYKVFRSVNFCQAPDQLESPNNDAVAGLGLNCSLVFLELNACLNLRNQLSDTGFNTTDLSKRLIPTGGSASNCDPKGIWVPDDAIDPVLYDEGTGPVSMASEVRSALAVGGFPFWDRLFRRKNFMSPLENTPQFRELQPTLMRNLVLG